jgi:hypothetical protein
LKRLRPINIKIIGKPHSSIETDVLLIGAGIMSVTLNLK